MFEIWSENKNEYFSNENLIKFDLSYYKGVNFFC